MKSIMPLRYDRVGWHAAPHTWIIVTLATTFTLMRQLWMHDKVNVKREMFFIPGKATC